MATRGPTLRVERIGRPPVTVAWAEEDHGPRLRIGVDDATALGQAFAPNPTARVADGFRSGQRIEAVNLLLGYSALQA